MFLNLNFEFMDSWKVLRNPFRAVDKDTLTLAAVAKLDESVLSDGS